MMRLRVCVDYFDHFQAGVSHATARGSRTVQVIGQRIFNAVDSVWNKLRAGEADAPPLTIAAGVVLMWSSPAVAVSMSGSGSSAATMARGATQTRSAPTAVLPSTVTSPVSSSERIVICAARPGEAMSTNGPLPPTGATVL